MCEKKLSRFILFFGVMFVSLSLYLDIDLFGKIVAQDGQIDNLFVMNYFWIFRLFLFLLGFILIFNHLYLSKLLKLKKELLLLFIVILLCLFLLEFVSFMIYKYKFTHLVYGDKKISYTHVEFNTTAEFNKFGFRDGEFNVSKQFRVAVVGDSFVFGVGGDKNKIFESLIERSLIKKSKDGVVFNLGVSGTYPSEYLDVINEMFPLLKPNLTIVALYLGNDLVCVRDNFFNNFFFPNLISLFKKIIFEYGREGAVNLLLAKPDLKPVYKDYLKKELINYEFFIGNVIHSPNISAQYFTQVEWFDDCEVNKQVIRKIRKSVESYGSKFVMVIIPSSYQVTSNNWPILREFGYIIDAALLNTTELEDSIVFFCNEEKMNCINLLPILRASKESPYFDMDPHFNSRGHNLTAEVILKYLKI